MQVVRRSFFLKANGLSTVAQNTSCSRGWLRLVVQATFAIITVASFILILIMAIRTNGSSTPANTPSRCHASYCRIRCLGAPYYDMYKEDIKNAIMFAGMSCIRIYLELINPKFENATLPTNWLSGLRGNIHGLAIKRGNLEHLPPDAFMSQFMGNIRVLILHDLTIKTWTADSFVGLSNLEEIHVDNCTLNHLQNETLRTVYDSLEQLTITRSGYWNPAHMIGSTNLARLSKVDFSSNNFGNIIDSGSFVGLSQCKILYLNSCKITAIGPGAFDHLQNIEIIYLSSNFLVSIPPGLFNNIMLIEDPRPRINLQDNLWFCDCSNTDLGLLVTKGMLLTDPICVSPAELYGLTFTRFHEICANNTTEYIDRSSEKLEFKFTNDYVYVNGTCQKDKSAADYKPLRVLYPMPANRCSTRDLANLDYFLMSASIYSRSMRTELSWITISLYTRKDGYSVVQIDSSGYGGYGLVWYQSQCPDLIYCIRVLPKFLRIYDINENARYTFCPVHLKTGYVEKEYCVGYDMMTLQEPYFQFQAILYFLIAVFCMILGATSVYVLVRRNPNLLKGSKRILFVKHKNVDALVLPPKVPLRSDSMNQSISENDKKISIISNDLKKISPNLLQPRKSIRSNKSNTPSYVSALQPTEDQLAEWRIRHHFNNDLTISSNSSEPSMMSSILSGDSSISYYSLETVNNRKYDTFL